MEKYGYVDWVRNHEQDFLLGSDPELTRRFEDDIRSFNNQNNGNHHVAVTK